MKIFTDFLFRFYFHSFLIIFLTNFWFLSHRRLHDRVHHDRRSIQELRLWRWSFRQNRRQKNRREFDFKDIQTTQRSELVVDVLQRALPVCRVGSPQPSDGVRGWEVHPEQQIRRQNLLEVQSLAWQVQSPSHNAALAARMHHTTQRAQSPSEHFGC